MAPAAADWDSLGRGSRPIRLVSLQNDSMLCSDPDSRRLGRGRVEHPGSGRLLQRCAHAHEDPWPPGCAGMLSGTQQECSPFEGLGLSTAQHSRARHGTAQHGTGQGLFLKFGASYVAGATGSNSNTDISASGSNECKDLL